MWLLCSDITKPLSRLLLRPRTGFPACSRTSLGKNMQWGTNSSQRHPTPLWIEAFSLHACLYLIAGNLGWPRGAGKHHRRRKVRSSAPTRRERAFWSQSPWKPPLPRQLSVPVVKNCNRCSGSVDRVFETQSIRRAHAALGKDGIGHPSVSTLGYWLKSLRNHLISWAKCQFWSHDSCFASDCGIFFFHV